MVETSALGVHSKAICPATTDLVLVSGLDFDYSDIYELDRPGLADKKARRCDTLIMSFNTWISSSL